MYRIAKEFEFDYSHRVWRQDLNFELSQTSCNKCRWPHGHRGKVVIYIDAENLNDKGMVFDFVELNFMKRFIDDNLDHKCIMDINDPALKVQFPLLREIKDSNFFDHDLLDLHDEGFYTIKPEKYLELENYERELYEGLVLVSFVPTSENLSKWLWDIVDSKIGHLCKVSQIQFFETPKSQSNYIKQ